MLERERGEVMALTVARDPGPDILTPSELARRLKVSLGTVYNNLGRLGVESGVTRPSARCTRINWHVFYARLCEGRISFGR